MNTLLQRLEIKRTVARDNDLAIQRTASRQLRAQRLNQLRKIAIQRLSVAALKQNFAAIAEDQRAKSVPFRLEDPGFANRQLTNAPGEHRLDWRIHGELHALYGIAKAKPSRSEKIVRRKTHNLRDL